MANRNDVQPLIIKRKKNIVGEGHHGGAWKVAYADFVTAMMAFFLLMWLLNATTESQRKGIADYFAPTVPISRMSGGGDNVLAGDSVFAEDTLARDGRGGTDHFVNTEQDGKVDEAPKDGSAATLSGPMDLSDVENKLRGMSGESDSADDILQHIRTRVTDEGLIIEIFARDGKPLFDSGSAEPTETMQRILDMVGDVISVTTNPIAVAGHTDAIRFVGTETDNWDLSLDRANTARRRLQDVGIELNQFARVIGMADRNLALPETPEDPRNRRITITLLRSDLADGQRRLRQ
ncbi:MAG: flagellar motor protein MotB [Pseudomonadota bacterium]